MQHGSLFHAALIVPLSPFLISPAFNGINFAYRKIRLHTDTAMLHYPFSMRDATIDKLLVLQERDIRRLDLETQLEAIPADISAVERKIAADKARLDEAKTRLRELDVARKGNDHEISAAEHQIARYKNQQLQVKKNDEYQALTHEIEITKAKVNDLEERGIDLLLKIDDEKARLTEIEAGFQKVMRQHETRIARLQERHGSLEAAVHAARTEVAEARQEISAVALAAYDRVSRLARMPAVVGVIDHTCKGCHLRISSEVEDVARKGERIATCDNCGRIVYLVR